ncbi:MAG: YkgJ family cysteine cluster protein [bacterium]
MNETSTIAAGDFGHWLQSTRAAQPAGVPCGECNACCRAGYFIHISEHEHRTLQKVPQALIFPAPGSAGRQWVMGYDETGACPMLRQNSCTVYPDRPQTCRDYDCRIFAAAGISARQPGEGGARKEVDAQVRRWRFSYSNSRDRRRHDAVKAAAHYLTQNQQQLAELAPATPTALALASVNIHELFLSEDTSDLVQPDPGRIEAQLRSLRTNN